MEFNKQLHGNVTGFF